MVYCLGSVPRGHFRIPGHGLPALCTQWLRGSPLPHSCSQGPPRSRHLQQVHPLEWFTAWEVCPVAISAFPAMGCLPSAPNGYVALPSRTRVHKVLLGAVTSNRCTRLNGLLPGKCAPWPFPHSRPWAACPLHPMVTWLSPPALVFTRSSSEPSPPTGAPA